VARLDSEIVDIADINCNVIHSQCKIIVDDEKNVICLRNIYMYVFLYAYG